MKKTWKRLCTGFLALATVVTALPSTPVHAESKQYWTESKERVGIVEKVMNDGSIGSTFNEGHLTVEGEDAYCIDINTDFKNGYKTRADASSRMSADQISDVALSLEYVKQYGEAHKELNYKQVYLLEQCVVWQRLSVHLGWQCDNVRASYDEIPKATQDEVFAGAKAFVKENKGRYECGGYIYSGEGQELGQFWAKLNVGNAKLQKTSSNTSITDGNGNYSVAGAIYGVFSDKDCTKQLATLTTDENGNTDVVEVKAGTVYIKELSAPAGYKVDKTVYSLKIEAGKTATLNVSDTPKVTDTLIELFKIDMETQKDNPQGNASLAGAEFTWKYYAGFYNKDNLPAEATRTWVTKTIAETDSDGTTHYITKLADAYKVSGDSFYMQDGKAVFPLGTLTVEETKAPNGYLLDGAYMQAGDKSEQIKGLYVTQITEDGDLAVLSGSNQFSVSDKVIRGGVKIQKRDLETGDTKPQGSATLKDTAFDIISLNDNAVLVEGKLYKKNEVVKATDLELEVGQTFDVSSDRTNLEIKDESRVKVTFQKAENDAGENFSTSHADTYHAVYYVEPVNQNQPVYQIGRNLIVKEPVTAAQSEPQTEQAVTEEDTSSDDEEAASQEETETVPVETEIVEPETAESETEEPEETEPEFQDGLSESEFDAALEKSETENTTDEESGLTLSDVLEQAGEQDIDLMAMEDGETVSFTAVNTSTRATQDVDVTRGTAYYYADYGLGSYVTYKYTVKFGNVSATAYCVQPSKAGPGDGVYKITKLGDSKALAKVCYYGTKASGENGFFSEKHPNFSAGKQFIIVHLAASYANNSGVAFSGTNATGQALAKELYDYCMSQPEIPEVDMSFSNADVTAYISGNGQRTEEITFKASELQTITMKLPSGVKLHNVTTGKTSSAGASVEICGGTKFYLSAPLTQAVDVKGEWSSTMKGSIIKDYSAYKITTGSETQDLALVFGEGVTDEKYVDFKVSWVKQATLEIVKKDRKSNKAIAGAVYGVYSDKDGKNLITKMPATDANGASSVTITKTQDTVYLKEISVPNGYLLDTKAYDIKLVIGDTVKQTVTDAEQMASLIVYKLGEVLTGADVTDNGVSFVYSEQKQKGAVYNVYAAADIVSADGTVIYKKDALVKAGLTTGDDGSATLDNCLLYTSDAADE